MDEILVQRLPRGVFFMFHLTFDKHKKFNKRYYHYQITTNINQNSKQLKWISITSFIHSLLRTYWGSILIFNIFNYLTIKLKRWYFKKIIKTNTIIIYVRYGIEKVFQKKLNFAIARKKYIWFNKKMNNDPP